MKILLDEHFPPAVAEQLRARGHDVVAVLERPGLRGLPDALLLAAAQIEERAVSTENVPDFLRLDAEHRARQTPHWGLVFTSNRRFPRGERGTVGALVLALDAIMCKWQRVGEASGRVLWLERPE